MKQALIVVAATFLAGVASAVNLKWDDVPLPEAQTVANGDGGWSGHTSIQNVLNKGKDKGYGVYAANNGGASSTMTGTEEGKEGYWSGTSITLAGRNGTQGESAALVLGGAIEAGARFSDFRLTATIRENTALNGKSVGFGIGIWDASANKFVQVATDSFVADGETSVSLGLALDAPFTWEEGDKLVVGIAGPGFSPPGTTYVIGDINVQAAPYSVPEPTALALLALGVAGIALRRRAA